jgi:hypothetical protein
MSPNGLNSRRIADSLLLLSGMLPHHIAVGCGPARPAFSMSAFRSSSAAPSVLLSVESVMHVKLESLAAPKYASCRPSSEPGTGELSVGFDVI